MCELCWASGLILAVMGAKGGVVGNCSYPTMRAISSIKSSSICKSNRNDGGVTVMTPGVSETDNPKHLSAWPMRSCDKGIPITLTARATRKLTGLIAGMLTCWSSIGPHNVCGVPQISITNCVMRSMCSTVSCGSTPRSNRWPASVEKLNRRDRPAIDAGHQKAASI